MNTLQPINSDTNSSSDASQLHGLMNTKHLEIVERSIESLKAEQQAGTPLDVEFITELEQRLERLKSIL
jgi:hypothetical protein